MNKLNKIFIILIIVETILLVSVSYILFEKDRTLKENAKATKSIEDKLYKAESELNNYKNKYDYGMDIEL